DDLAEGKATLPLIHAMAQADAATRARLRTIVEQGDKGAMPEVLAAIRAAGSLEYSRARAREYAAAAEAALAPLPANDARAAARAGVVPGTLARAPCFRRSRSPGWRRSPPGRTRPGRRSGGRARHSHGRRRNWAPPATAAPRPRPPARCAPAPRPRRDRP